MHFHHAVYTLGEGKITNIDCELFGKSVVNQIITQRKKNDKKRLLWINDKPHFCIYTSVCLKTIDTSPRFYLYFFVRAICIIEASPPVIDELIASLTEDGDMEFLGSASMYNLDVSTIVVPGFINT